ncbi:hypothetical protein [Mycoplasmopsis gallinarum]|uniref:DUF4231 domain-containing protein n=1 Tax=Mycoplasmopsis gallinarum TaxID=29557 RepID=A0A168RIF2_9BACT|nr:hypothetical protein [Mycoplasmopsis gallinarum]OAB49014.1 hypothetical protein MGALLINA_02340 [Mycoplasmopsis gallinarum]
MQSEKIIAYYKRLVKNTTNLVWILGFIYYLFNFIVFLATLSTGVIGTWFLAGNSKFFTNTNPYTTWLNLDSNYIITLTYINSIVALTTGLLSFFLVNDRYKTKMSQLRKLKFEYALFQAKQLYYADNTTIDRQYIFYKRILNIINYDRYRKDSYSQLETEIKIEKEKRNGK